MKTTIRSGRWPALLILPAAMLFLGAAGPPERAAVAPPPDSQRGAEAKGAPAAGGEARPDRKHPQTYLEFAIAGGPVMIAIGACSLVWLAYLLERLIVTRRSRVLPGALVRGMKAKPGGGAPERAQVEALCQAHPSAAASVLRAALQRLDRPREELERGVENAARHEINWLRRNVRLFAILASVATLLGLLGTVTGMIRSFREVAIEGLGAGKNLAPGIYEALINTAGGLIVAIPALLTYYWLMSRVERYVNEIDTMVVQFVDARGGGALA